MDYNLIINFAIIVLLVWFVYSRFAGVRGLKNLQPDQFQDALKRDPNHILIDVHEPGEVQQGRIAGAINIPLSQMKQRAGEIPAGKSVYLYCRSGMRSKLAARILQKRGFRELAHLQGGILSWNGNVVR
ncbi:rhodanese-like domain-containing protein [Paenibacillus thalictri]|uniref:Rhodanese-like domain-containing protein n=1 Tax=Paenibacillus thalictri TaxID=2527873 RepID=A0A4Q9DPW9_9BACL|nr:rhodanese-like domain-containing protein [Paenibacillus thalictri]TBL76378.1 rhodanese-like domain-containing protein [Paenibacillus thalictri]